MVSGLVNSATKKKVKPTRFPCPWGFSKQEYWSGLPFPPSEDLPDPGIELESSALAGVTPEPQDVNEPGF